MPTNDPSDNRNSASKYTTSSDGPRSHRDADSTVQSFECEFCEATFQDEGTLISHTTGCGERPSDARYKCQYCGNQYISEHALINHRDQCSAKQAAAHSSNQSSPTHECSKCGREFTSRREMMIHEHTCTGSELSTQSGATAAERTVTGTVVSFDAKDGYGFIEMADRSDNVFFHVSDYEGPAPSEGDYLQFDLKHREKGAKAVNITDADAELEAWEQKFASDRPRWGNKSTES